MKKYLFTLTLLILTILVLPPTKQTCAYIGQCCNNNNDCDQSSGSEACTGPAGICAPLIGTCESTSGGCNPAGTICDPNAADSHCCDPLLCLDEDGDTIFECSNVPAQPTYPPLPPVSTPRPNPTGYDLNDPNLFSFAGKNLGYYISPLIRTSITGAGLISFFLAIGAGIMIINNAGNPQEQAKGKQILNYAVMGLVLVFSAFWIIQIIEVLTGVAILSSGL